MNTTNELGTWKVQGNMRILVTPSDEYIKNSEQQEMLDSLIPSSENVEDAEFELKLITKLSEWGVI